jgi:F0F1-type ATP synthase gamma subunit
VDCHIIFNRWKNYLCQISNVQTAELLVPENRHSEDEIATEKLQKYKSPDNDKILQGLVQRGKTLQLRDPHLLFYMQ